MNINDAFPSKYLKSGDVPEDSDLPLTIKSVSVETVGQGDDAEQKPIIHFEETEKGLVLNKTNAETISRLHTPETDNWPGKRIALFSTEVDFGGKQTLALRVRMKSPKQTTQAAPVSGDPTEGLYANTSAFSLTTVRQWTDLVKRAMAAGVVMSFNLDETDTPQNLGTRVNAIKAQIEKANKPEVMF